MGQESPLSKVVGIQEGRRKTSEKPHGGDLGAGGARTKVIGTCEISGERLGSKVLVGSQRISQGGGQDGAADSKSKATKTVGTKGGPGTT